MIPRPHFVSHSAASKESQTLAETEYAHQKRFREARERARKEAKASGLHSERGLAELDAKFVAEWIDSHSAGIKQRLAYAQERQATYRERISNAASGPPVGLKWDAEQRREYRTRLMAMPAPQRLAELRKASLAGDKDAMYSAIEMPGVLPDGHPYHEQFPAKLESPTVVASRAELQEAQREESFLEDLLLYQHAAAKD
jgi:hypothetical protein